MTSKTTRRGLLAGAPAAVAAVAVSALPAIALADAVPSTEPLVALVARQIELRFDERAAYLRWCLFKLSPEARHEFIGGLKGHWPDADRAALAKRIADYDEKAEDEDAEARSADTDRLDDEIAQTRATTLDGLLAKLRWLINNMSEAAVPEIPTLETAYEFCGENSHDHRVARVWADAERLIGGVP